MAINTNAPAAGSFAGMFGNKGAPAAHTPAADRPKSQFWLNVGYAVETPANGDTPAETKFVSLPVGIPLDGMQLLPTNSKNADFANFQSARNDLLNQLAELATSLKPGEERIVQLQVQVRRVNEETAPIASASNPFARKLAL